MNRIYVLYNTYANNGRGYENAKEISKYYLNQELCFIDIIKINNYKVFLEGLKKMIYL